MIKHLDPHIAVIGEPGSGKSTAAEILNELGYRTASFAGFHPGGLRDVVQRVFGLSATRDRETLNKVGLGCRAIDPGFWVVPWLHEFARLEALGPVVTDDLRFENEYAWLCALGFVFICVKAPREQCIARLTASGKFQGEAQLDDAIQSTQRGFDVDYTIQNDSTREDLGDQLLDILHEQREKRR